MADVNRELHGEVLKGVSRSFFLTLRMLPGPMRWPAGLAYLLARATDTVADSSLADVGIRLEVLERMRMCLHGQSVWQALPAAVVEGVADGRERQLLEMTGVLLEVLREQGAEVGGLIREVLETIISGQRMDLERFAGASAGAPVVLGDDCALHDYTWRVAGCVGAFWTKLGFEVLGEDFSSAPRDGLEERAVAYGKGLQMVNILRDLPGDLAQGRCYLPVACASDREELMDAHQRYLGDAVELVRHGVDYADALHSKRLRVASGLPALIAVETLERMRGVSWEQLECRVKVGRWSVYRLLLEAMCR